MFHPKILLTLVTVVSVSIVGGASAGDFAPAAGVEGTTAVGLDDARIVGWASSTVELTRGPIDISFSGADLAGHGEAADAVGAAEGNAMDVVSLGDGGSITLAFDQPIRNGMGYDLAVFENGFNNAFLELAFVEVSSDGVNFVRFDAISQTQTDTQVATFGTLDATNLYNLAGKYRQGYGTPFDLAELAGVNPLLDVTAVTHVRIIDVVGSINPAYGSADSLGNMVNDPFTTPFATGGFDLDGVAMLAREALSGDANLDGTAGLLDLDILGRYYGMRSQAKWVQGDFNGDGAVGLLDLDILGRNYSTVLTPEPTSLVLLATASLVITGRWSMMRNNSCNTTSAGAEDINSLS